MCDSDEKLAFEDSPKNVSQQSFYPVRQVQTEQSSEQKAITSIEIFGAKNFCEFDDQEISFKNHMQPVKQTKAKIFS